MHFKNIMALFLIVLPMSIAIRFMQLVFTVDASTGFFKQGYRLIGFIMFVLVFLMCAVVAIISFTAFRKPENPPKVNIFLGVSSLLLAAAIGYEIVTETFVSSIKIWQIISLDITGLLTMIFFIIYGLKMFIDFPLPGIFPIVVPLYWIVKLICIFTTVSSLSLITDTVMTLACQCFALLFTANFAKVFNKIDDDKLFRKVLSTGLSTSILCLCDSIPRIYLTLSHREQYLHSTATSTLSLLATGLFALIFTISFFSNNNLKHHHHHH